MGWVEMQTTAPVTAQEVADLLREIEVMARGDLTAGQKAIVLAHKRSVLARMRGRTVTVASIDSHDLHYDPETV